MIRKTACIVLCLMLMAPLAMADDQPRQLTEDDPGYAWLYEKSMEIARSFQKSLNNPFHLFLILPSQASKEELKEELQFLQMQDYSAPLDVAIVRTDQPLDDDSIAEIIEQGYEMGQFSDREKADVLRELYESTAVIVSAENNTALTVISNELSIKRSDACPEKLDGPCFVVMFYGGLYAYLITCYPLDGGIVRFYGQVIPSRTVDALNLPVE